MITALTLAAFVGVRLWLGISYARYMSTQSPAAQRKMAELRAQPNF